MSAKYLFFGARSVGLDCMDLLPRSNFRDLNVQTVSHHIWLRDHCRCPDCFHPITKQRLLNTFEVVQRQDGESVFAEKRRFHRFQLISNLFMYKALQMASKSSVCWLN
jgi:hypothetical protein